MDESSRRHISIIGLAALAMVLALALGETLAGALESAVPRQPAAVARAEGQATVVNPMASRFRAISQEHRLDLDFDLMGVGRSKGALADFPLFDAEPGSLDLLFFGDSTIAWGLIPEVIEEMTGLEAAAFAFESNVLNRRFVHIASAVADTYLRPGGRIVLAFAPWSQTKGPELVRNKIRELENLRAALDGKGVLAWVAEHERTRRIEEGRGVGLAERFSYAGYNAGMGELRTRLARDYGMRLPDIDFYAQSIEPVLNPRWSELKRETSEKERTYLRWGVDSTLLFVSRFEPASTSAADTFVHDPTARVDPANSGAILELGRRHRVLYMIGPRVRGARWERSVYVSEYASVLGLIDVGHAAHTAGVALPMRGNTHLANESGLLVSILVAEALAAPTPCASWADCPTRNAQLDAPAP